MTNAASTPSGARDVLRIAQELLELFGFARTFVVEVGMRPFVFEVTASEEARVLAVLDLGHADRRGELRILGQTLVQLRERVDLTVDDAAAAELAEVDLAACRLAVRVGDGHLTHRRTLTRVGRRGYRRWQRLRRGGHDGRRTLRRRHAFIALTAPGAATRGNDQH